MVSKCVPRQVAYEVCKMVPVTVCAQSDCSSCGGCATCGATAPAGPGPIKPQAEAVPQPQDVRKPPMEVIPSAKPPVPQEPGTKLEGAPQTQPSLGGPKA
jgi:hypothetical protein